ncbi:hypothetical protein [Thermaerobacter litoralis]
MTAWSGLPVAMGALLVAVFLAVRGLWLPAAAFGTIAGVEAWLWARTQAR